MSAIRPVDSAFYELCRCFAYIAVRLVGRVRHYNVPDLSAVNGGLLVVSNHQSFWDPPLVGSGCGRQLNYLARESLFRVPGFGRLIRALGARPVRRGAVDSRALKTVLRLLREGHALLMFPEGTRTRDGKLGQFKPGAAAIALRCAVPVLPVCVEGSYRSWPRSHPLPKAAPMAVAFGPLLTPDDRSAEELTAQICREIRELQCFLRGRLDGGPAHRGSKSSEK